MCFVGDGDAARVGAMRGFWTGEGGDGKAKVDRYAGLILTAGPPRRT